MISNIKEIEKLTSKEFIEKLNEIKKICQINKGNCQCCIFSELCEIFDEAPSNWYLDQNFPELKNGMIGYVERENEKDYFILIKVADDYFKMVYFDGGYDVISSQPDCNRGYNIKTGILWDDVDVDDMDFKICFLTETSDLFEAKRNFKKNIGWFR